MAGPENLIFSTLGPAVSDLAVEETEAGLRLHPISKELSHRNSRQHPSANLTNNLGGQIRSHLPSPRGPMHAYGQDEQADGALAPPVSIFQTGHHSPAHSTWSEGRAGGARSDSLRTL